LSRVLGSFERFLAESGFDRAPWLGVAFGAGIAAWFILESVDSWLFLLGVSFGASVAAFGLAFRNPDIPILK